MTHRILQNGRIVKVNGYTLTSEGGAPCCCGDSGPHDVVCPGETGYCLRVELVGFIAQGCTTPAVGPNTGSFGANVETLIVDGPLSVDQNDLISGRGLVAYQSSTPVNGSTVNGTDTEISGSVIVRCDSTTGRPYLQNIGIEISGGGDAETRLTLDNNLFRAAVTTNIPGPRIWLDQGPVTIPNVYRDPDVYPSTACVHTSGNGLAVTSTGSVRVELVYDEQCNQPNYDMILASKCDDPSQTIVVDPDTSNGLPGIEYQGESYRPIGRTTGTPVSVTWVADVCGGPSVDQWPVARLCGGTDTITYDPDQRPQDGLTLLWGGDRYTPISSLSTVAPVGAVWSPDPCPSTGGLCSGITDPSDPRCDDPVYKDCPQCVGFDIGDPDIQPTSPQSTDPAVQAEIERQQMARTGQYPGRCPSCGG